MSAKHAHAAEILSWYAAGYFPLYDLANHFYWERLPIRAVIPVTTESVARAHAMARRPRKKYILRRNTAVGEVIAHLQDPRVKENSWVRAEVMAIYRTLNDAGLLQTIEAFDAKTNRLAGGLLGVALPGTFIAETMFALQPDASKLCLSQLLIDAAGAGFRLIDVQTPHDLEHYAAYGLPSDSADRTPHPCIRLGEQTLSLPHFLKLFKAAAAAAFPGSLSDWLLIASTLSLAARKPAQSTVLLSHLKPAQLAAARPMLQPEFAL